MFRNFIGWLFGFNLQMRQLKEQLQDLSWDTAFGMYTRSGLMTLAKSQFLGKKSVAFLDLDRIHELNERYGYDEVDRRVRAAFSANTRKGDALAARWWSGDEILLVLDCNTDRAYHVLERLASAASTQKLSFTCAIGQWDTDAEDLNSVVTRLSKQVLHDKAIKASRRQLQQVCA